MLIVFAGLVNLVPVSGVVSAERLQALYGIPFEDATLLVLMRHRAILFGIIGGILVVSAFHRPLRAVGYPAGLVSMLSFVLIAWLVGDHDARLTRLAIVDLVASVGLVGAMLIDRSSKDRISSARSGFQ